MKYRRKTANDRLDQLRLWLTGRIVRAAALARRTNALVRTAQPALRKTGLDLVNLGERIATRREALQSRLTKVATPH
jgi:hypothetical protein